MNSRINQWFVFILLILAGLTGFAQENAENTTDETAYPAKWIYLIKAPEAVVQKTKSGEFKLIVSDVNQTQIYMLSDRPFYVIRQAEYPAQNFKIFAQSNYQKDLKVKATVIFDGHSSEVLLSHFKKQGNRVSYTLTETSQVQPLTEATGPMDLFVTTNSYPLCNLMNQLKHDGVSLTQLQQLMKNSSN
jgi:hypothetical protein